MSDVTNAGVTLAARGKEAAPQDAPFELDETYWGYIVRKTEPPATSTIVLQFLSMFVGAVFVAVALGLLLLPEVLSGAVDLSMRAVAAIIFMGMAGYLLYFASRGSQSEIQIDTSLGEAREVVRNRAGRSTLIGRYGFDSIGGVFLDRAQAAPGHATLVLRYRNTAQTVPVVRGRITALEGLRDRMGRDMMINRVEVRSEKTIVPTSF